MARPRKPVKVLELTGSFKKNPGRRRSEPEPRGPLGDPPAYFSEELAAVWTELAAVVPAGILTAADAPLLEITSRLLHEFRTNPDFKVGRLSCLTGCLAKLGMNPADRARVMPPAGKKEPTPWDNF